MTQQRLSRREFEILDRYLLYLRLFFDQLID
jgi:hypothetical protein